jgi:hypothetical protein
MASTYSDLKIELIGTGDQTGTWGTTTNNNFSIALSEAITGSANVAFSSADVTVTLTDTNAAQTARNLRLNLTGTSGGARQLILGSGCQIEKLYLVNNGLADAVTVKNTSGTGIAVPAGKSMFVFNDGTNVVDATTYLSSLTLGTALPVASGGTGLATLTANNVIIGNGTSAPSFVAPGSNGNILTSNGTTWTSSAAPAGGVTTITFGSTGLTPSTATSGAVTVAGTLAIGNGGTGATTLAGANIPVTNVANSFTGTQTFTGSSSATAIVLNDAAEVATVSATAATGTINYDITTQSVLYYTSNASANWTVNFRASSGTSLNTLMSTGQSMTVAFLVTQGSTAYYNSSVQIDGTTSGVTVRWLGGAPAAGNASGIDSYRYLIIKTGSATFTVLASNTQFKA